MVDQYRLHMLLTNDKFQEEREYWLKQLAGGWGMAGLPVAPNLPPLSAYEPSTIGRVLDAETVCGIWRIGNGNKIATYLIVLAAVQILLARLNDQRDSVIGMPAFVEEEVAAQPLSLSAIRTRLENGMSFRQLLLQVRETVNLAKRYKNIPYEVVAAQVRPTEQQQPPAPFRTVVRMADLHVAVQPDVLRTELLLTISQTADAIELTLVYDEAVCSRKIAERLLEDLNRLLQGVTSDTERAALDANFLPDAEVDRLVVEWNRTNFAFDEEKLLVQRFDEQVQANPDQIAIRFHGAECTYEQLDKRTNQLAHFLRDHGVTRGSLVGLMVPRSVQMLVALLGILKAGGAYVPIDPSYPKGKVQHMLQDSAAVALLTVSELADSVSFAGTVIDVENVAIAAQPEASLEPVNTAQDVAYVIYTSGSTGTPKGVMVEQRAVSNFICGMRQQIDFQPGKRMLCLTTISFDIFVLESLVPLTSGLTIVLADERTQNDPHLMASLIQAEQVQMMQSTPSRLLLALKSGQSLDYLQGLHEIMIGGEALPKHLLVELRKHTKARIYNMYGPTETTVWSAVKEVTKAAEPVIGPPIANTQLYVLDDALRLQPIGTPGELYISGLGLARGYLKRDKLTSERFLPNPFVPGQRMYKTGDCVRRMPNGDLQFIGRLDHQVKIRGYRVELGEIESRLRQKAGIKEAAVVAIGEEGNAQLAAYYLAEAEFPVTEIREHLAETLPEYMVPALYMHLKEMPLTDNGKLDRKALPDMSSTRPLLEVEYVAPRNEQEQELAALWKDLLKKEDVGIHDNFFELGGTSSLVVMLHAQLEAKNPGRLLVADLFTYPTISKLVAYLQEAVTDEVKIELSTVPLPTEFFAAAQDREETVIEFEVAGETFARLQNLTTETNVSLVEVLLGLYGCLLAEVSDEPNFAVQTITERTDAIVSIPFAMDQVEELRDAFRQVRDARMSMLPTYAIERLRTLDVPAVSGRIVPFFLSENVSTREFAHVYDLLMRVELKPDRAVIQWESRPGLLRYAYFEHLVKGYLQLLQLSIQSESR